MSTDNNNNKKLGIAGGAIGAFLTTVIIAVLTSENRPWWFPFSLTPSAEKTSPLPAPSPSPSPSPVVPPAANSERRYAVKWQSDGFAIVREKPTTESPEVGRFRPGTVIYCGGTVAGQLGSRGDQWRYCQKAGGYIYAPLLTAISE